MSPGRLASTALDGTAAEWVILRPQGLFGADRPATVQLFRTVAHRRVWIHGPARVLIHPTHIRDLVSAVALVLGREGLGREGLGGEVINVGGERALEFRELIALIGARLGHTPAQVAAPGWTASVAAAGALVSAAAGMPVRTLERLARRLVNRAVDTEKARLLLGYTPQPLERGLDETAAVLRPSIAS